MVVDRHLVTRIDFFRGLSAMDHDRLAAIAVPKDLMPGEVLFLEGEVCRGLYAVQTGSVRIYKTSPEGREQVLIVAGPGDSFAEVPVFDGGPNPASASAVGATSILIFPREPLLNLVSASPELALGVIRVFATRVRRMADLVEDLSFRHVSARVAKLLLETLEDGDPAVVRRLTQQEMASMIGTAREVVARSLRVLEQRGAIALQRGRITIVRPDVLESLL